MSWMLYCVWCPFRIWVGDRGQRGHDMGAGVEAAEWMESHVKAEHDKTWKEFLAERNDARTSIPR